MAVDYMKLLRRVGCNGFSCAHCSRILKSDDLVACCSDCAAIFCAECVENNAFEGHRCEDYEYEDDYEVD